jgi:Domain of unknown function (DUF4350)
MLPPKRVIYLGAIALVMVILVIFSFTPSQNIKNGSSYNRGPEGYAGWYAFMQNQGVKIQRWQRPFVEIEPETKPITLIQVNPELVQINSNLVEANFEAQQIKWIKQGNTLVILGIKQPSTAAEFTTYQESPLGRVKIDTSRRYVEPTKEEVLLGDRFGAVVWQWKSGKGKVIFATTIHLAANAYQDEANFRYLAKLVTDGSEKILVDEYIHGYKDINQNINYQTKQGNLLNYFAKTPLFPMLLQLSVVVVLLIWSGNRRFGRAIKLDIPTTENSRAYIQALAAVLRKAQSSDFVLEMIGKEEQLQLQKVLGMGNTPANQEDLIEAWQQQTGKSPAELEELLKVQTSKHRISEKNLLNWLAKWQSLRKNQSLI